MSKIDISLFASAVRIKDWLTFYDSLKPNTINWEVVFCGNKKPDFELPENFKFIYANVKPAQCYEIAARACKGELLGWTCDDATYSMPGTEEKNLDNAYNFYKKLGQPKIIVAMRPIEDGRDIWYHHHFFGKWRNTPFMAPMGLINREFFKELGGYDRNFISAQAENDIVMRAIEQGGRAEICMNGKVYIHHQKCHIGSEHKSMVRQHYNADRQVLENAWVVGGYGAFGPGGAKMRPNIQISNKRLKPVESFVDESITETTQGPKGLGEIHWN